MPSMASCVCCLHLFSFLLVRYSRCPLGNHPSSILRHMVWVNWRPLKFPWHLSGFNQATFLPSCRLLGWGWGHSPGEAGPSYWTNGSEVCLKVPSHREWQWSQPRRHETDACILGQHWRQESLHIIYKLSNDKTNTVFIFFLLVEVFLTFSTQSILI